MALARLKGLLRQAGKGYVLGVAKNHSVTSWGKAKPIAGTAESVAHGLASSDWKRLSAGDGAKGPRLYDWAYVELADLDASAYDASRSGLWTRGLLVRRTIADQRPGFLFHLGSGGNLGRQTGPRRRLPLGHRGQLRDDEKRVGP